jgi:hypothetical protein
MMTVKEAVMTVPTVVGLWRAVSLHKKVEDLAVTLTLETRHPSRKRRKPMENLNEFARQWKDVLLKLSLSHTKEGIDQADYRMEDLFAGLLAMPVKQVRQFYDLLLSELKSDESVPYFIWKTVEHWKEKAVGVSQDVEANMLQSELATDLAAILEPVLSPQLKEALAGSLKWKPGEVLEKIKAAVEAGEKPKLRGRESCLFLEIGKSEIML